MIDEEAEKAKQKEINFTVFTLGDLHRKKLAIDEEIAYNERVLAKLQESVVE